MLDFADPQAKNDLATDDLLAMTKCQKSKISRKKRPTVYLRGDNRIA